LLIGKKRDLWFGMEYWWLNDVAKKGCFPLPKIDDTLDTLAGAK
jgi:hypothetical protein